MKKRAHTRHEVQGVYVRTGGSSVLHSSGLVSGTADHREVLDIGSGGPVFISCCSPPQRGEWLSVDLYLLEGAPPQTVRAKVVWTEDVSALPPHDVAAIWRQASLCARHRVGLRFDDVPESLAVTIDRLGHSERPA